uniref:MUS81 structure-specific endonuclease subunit n=1 Tax=Piliocolobus tephrosceles TaxID=591936 RepID=A0A8C9IEV5_9PRIM
MALTAHPSCLLALLLAGLAQGIRGSLRAQDLGPQPLELKEAFKLFQIQFNRSYPSPEEHARRLDIFAHNLAQAQRLQEEDLGTAEFGVTPFSDLTEEEFGQLYGYRRAAGRVPGMGREIGPEEPEESVPFTCDWRKVAGAISPIKDQKNCNCCWAMAAAGNIEALWRINFWDFVDVSVQGGLASEKDYPFQGKVRAQGCHANKYHKVAWIQDFIMLQNSEHTVPERCDQGHTHHLRPPACRPLCPAGGFWQRQVRGDMGRGSLSPASASTPRPILDPEELLGGPVGREGECDLLGEGQSRTGLFPPVSPNLLGLLPAAPREQYLWHHQVPAHCPCAETGCEAPSLLPSLNPPGPLSSVLLGQLPPRQPYPQVFAHLPNGNTA